MLCLEREKYMLQNEFECIICILLTMIKQFSVSMINYNSKGCRIGGTVSKIHIRFLFCIY